jgi:ATP-dependent Clp protease adaptor protein ClpS
MPQQQTNIREHERTILKEPRLYKVILHNDDFTTMDFVVKVLITVFKKAEAEAQNLMMEVHVKGRATAGIYTLDLAISMTNKSMKMAREEGFPLRLTYEPCD